MANVIDLDSKQKHSYYSNFKAVIRMVQSLWKAFLVQSLSIPSILNIPFGMKIGPVLMLFLLLISL